MVIMYLHISAVYLVSQIFLITPLWFLVIGILGPMLFYMIVKVEGSLDSENLRGTVFIVWYPRFNWGLIGTQM